MPRRAVVAAALVALSSASLTAATAAPKAPACPVVTDPKGDAADPSLDVTQVTYAKSGKALVGTIKVAKLADNVATAWGDRFVLEFVANDKQVEVYFKRSRTRDQEANVFYQKGLRVDGTFVSDAGIDGKHDLDSSTVTISIALSALKAGVGKSVDGAEISNLGTTAQGSFVAYNVAADTVESETTFRVAPCLAKK